MWQHLYDDILQKIAPVTKKGDDVTISLNKQFNSVTTLQPDLVWRDVLRKRICIIEVSAPLEGSSEALKIVRQQKVEKYKHLTDEIGLPT